MAAGAAPGSNVSPPFANLPFVVQHPDGQYYVSITALQFLQTLWSAITPQVLTVATLSASPTIGQRGFVGDSAVVAAGNFGEVVVGGGVNAVPVYYDGQWRIG